MYYEGDRDIVKSKFVDIPIKYTSIDFFFVM